jgi:hypothetical protein
MRKIVLNLVYLTICQTCGKKESWLKRFKFKCTLHGTIGGLCPVLRDIFLNGPEQTHGSAPCLLFSIK